MNTEPDSAAEKTADPRRLGAENSELPDLLAQAIKGGGGKDQIIREVFTGLVMGPAVNPIAQKITPQHIDKLLDADNQKQKDSHSHRTHKLLALGAAFVLTLAFVLILAYWFREKDGIVTHLLTATFALLTGLAGGFGLGRVSRED